MSKLRGTASIPLEKSFVDISLPAAVHLFQLA
jgi:hypothetical protein